MPRIYSGDVIFLVNISKALPLAVAWATHSFQHCFDINNDEAMGNHSEETVVTVAVFCWWFPVTFALFSAMIYCCFCDDFWVKFFKAKQRWLPTRSTSSWKLKYFGLEVLRRLFCAAKYFGLKVEVLLKSISEVLLKVLQKYFQSNSEILWNRCLSHLLTNHSKAHENIWLLLFLSAPFDFPNTITTTHEANVCTREEIRRER
jgi:hypothetical protein